jgi:hypothetical protein
MSVRTIYKCDKCGAEQDESEQFWKVMISAQIINYYGSSYPVKDIQVCRPCLESFGIHDQRPVAVKETAPAPSVEDLIRQIMEMVTEGKEKGL